MDVVEEVLKKSANDADKYKSTAVDKVIETDLGCLLALDANSIDLKKLQKSTEDYLMHLTRENTQYLFNQIWELPTERIDECIVAKLPKKQFRLPRFKPVPKPREPTKWEKFAKEKGIVKKKKSKLSWDEQLQKWIPLYGFKRAQAQKDKDWVLEVPQNADPMEDQFAKKIVAKSEKVAKNELQRLRNIAKSKNVKVPRFGVTNPEVSSAKDLQAAVTVAKSSTASLGRFQPTLPKEKEAKGVADITPGAANRKRKLAPVSGDMENKLNLDIAESVLSKRPKIDLNKAVDRAINEEQVERSTERKSSKKSKSGGGGGKKKPKNANRPRKGKVAGGRKRR